LCRRSAQCWAALLKVSFAELINNHYRVIMCQQHSHRMQTSLLTIYLRRE